MFHSQRMSFKFALSATVIMLVIRLAIATDIIASKGFLRAAKVSAITIFIGTVGNYALKLCIMWSKMQKLPGYDWRFVTIFFRAVLSKNFRRGVSLPIIYAESLAALSLLKYEDDEQDVCAALSWLVPIVFVKSPDTFKQVLHHPHAQKKGPAYISLRFAVGNGLLTSSGEEWTNHRKLLTPAFHFKILESAMSIVVPEAELLAKKLEQEASTSGDRSIKNLIPHVLSNTMNVLCQTSMGISSTDDSNVHALKTGVNHWMAMISYCQANPLLLLDCMLGVSGLAKEYNKFDRAFRSFVDRVIYKRLALFQRKATATTTAADDLILSENREAFIDIMIRQHMKNPESFSIKEMREEVKIFTSAGLDTTTWSVTYTLLLLGHHQEEQERLYQELQEYFSENEMSHLTPERIKKFTYLNAVYSESLRLYPPAPAFARQITQDIVVNDRVIPKGAQVVFLVSNVHRDARFWPDPARFKPERFLVPLADPYSFLPFSAGPRNCIGQKYANIQAKTSIIQLIHKYRIESITQLDEVTTYAFPIAHTEAPIKLRLHLRQPNDSQ